MEVRSKAATAAEAVELILSGEVVFPNDLQLELSGGFFERMVGAQACIANLCGRSWLEPEVSNGLWRSPLQHHTTVFLPW